MHSTVINEIWNPQRSTIDLHCIVYTRENSWFCASIHIVNYWGGTLVISRTYRRKGDLWARGRWKVLFLRDSAIHRCALSGRNKIAGGNITALPRLCHPQGGQRSCRYDVEAPFMPRLEWMSYKWIKIEVRALWYNVIKF